MSNEAIRMEKYRRQIQKIVDRNNIGNAKKKQLMNLILPYGPTQPFLNTTFKLNEAREKKNAAREKAKANAAARPEAKANANARAKANAARAKANENAARAKANKNTANAKAKANENAAKAKAFENAIAYFVLKNKTFNRHKYNMKSLNALIEKIYTKSPITNALVNKHSEILRNKFYNEEYLRQMKILENKNRESIMEF